MDPESPTAVQLCSWDTLLGCVLICFVVSAGATDILVLVSL
jgi:hypothetical protein